MKSQELKQLSREELDAKLKEAVQLKYHTREEIIKGKDKNHAALRIVKRDIARIMTCISELSRS